MPTFDEYVTMLREPAEGQELPPSIYDDLTREYNSAVEFSSAAKAKNDEYEDRIKGYESEISRLKSKNYDLMVNSPASENEPNTKNDNDDAPQGIDSLFGE